MIDWEWITREAAQLLSRLIQIPTISGQGLETEAAEVLLTEAVASGLAAQIYEPVLGAGSFVACLPGESEASLLLLSHLDVAPPGRVSDWRVPPFGGVVREGAVWGRGAVDAKGLAVTWLLAMQLMQRHAPLKRGLVLAVTAGEEGDGHNGLQWLLEHGLLKDCRWALGEGGGTPLPVGRSGVVLLQTAEKGSLLAQLPSGWRHRRSAGRLTGCAGPDQRALRSAYAAARGWPGWAVPLLPPQLLEARCRYRIHLAEQGCHRWQVNPEAGVLTCSIGPGTSTAQVLARLGRTLGLAADELTILHRVEPTASMPAGPLYEILKSECRRWRPGFQVGPFCTPGYSDNRLARAAGIPTFGCFPLPPEEVIRQHQPNERIGVASLQEAIRVVYRVLQQFCR